MVKIYFATTNEKKAKIQKEWRFVFSRFFYANEWQELLDILILVWEPCCMLHWIAQGIGRGFCPNAEQSPHPARYQRTSGHLLHCTCEKRRQSWNKQAFTFSLKTNRVLEAIYWIIIKLLSQMTQQAAFVHSYTPVCLPIVKEKLLSSFYVPLGKDPDSVISIHHHD